MEFLNPTPYRFASLGLRLELWRGVAVKDTHQQRDDESVSIHVEGFLICWVLLSRQGAV